MKIINIDINYKNPFNVSKAASKFIIKSLNLAHRLALNKNIAGIINCPINKNLLNKKNSVTEFLSSKCLIKNDMASMVIGNSVLMVSPITIHLDLKSVSKKLKKSLIINKVKKLDIWFKKLFKRKPNVALLGLNLIMLSLKKTLKKEKLYCQLLKN